MIYVYLIIFYLLLLLNDYLILLLIGSDDFDFSLILSLFRIMSMLDGLCLGGWMGLEWLIGGGGGEGGGRGGGDGGRLDGVGGGYTSLFYFYNFKAGFYKFFICCWFLILPS